MLFVVVENKLLTDIKTQETDLGLSVENNDCCNNKTVRLHAQIRHNLEESHSTDLYNESMNIPERVSRVSSPYQGALTCHYSDLDPRPMGQLGAM